MTFIMVYQIRHIFKRMFLLNHKQSEIFKYIWTEARACTELQRSVEMGSEKNRQWQTSNIDWLGNRQGFLCCFSLSLTLLLSSARSFFCLYLKLREVALYLFSNHVPSHCLRRHLSCFCHPFWRPFKCFDYFCLIFPCEPLYPMGIAFVLYCI